MSDSLMSRRTALIGASAGAVGATIAISPLAHARAPLAVSQVPYFYRFMVGKFQATVVSDGPLPLGEPSATMKGITKEEIGKALTDNFLPTDGIVLEQNCLVLNTGTKLVLFDSGMGTSKMFGGHNGSTAGEPAGSQDQSLGDRRHHLYPRAHRPYRRPRLGQGPALLPQCDDPHIEGRLRFLDRREEGQ